MSSIPEIYSAVHSHYTAASNCRTSTGHYESSVAQAFGYTAADLSSIPAAANLGLSCGNPVALAGLRAGETVVDLGCGAGFDVFLAARQVGASGRVVGVDVNAAMLAKAERNRQASGVENVRFVHAPITAIAALGDESADCVISNCVVNLVPDAEKYLVFREMYRVLRPGGGRVAISDILIRDGRTLPAHLKDDMALLVGCIAGASPVSDYKKHLNDAGFQDILIVDNRKDLNVYNADVGDGETGRSCCGTTVPGQDSNSCRGALNEQTPPEGGTASVNPNVKGIDFNAYAGSYNIYAVKA